MNIDFEDMESDSELQSQQAVEFSDLSKLVTELGNLTAQKDAIEVDLKKLDERISELQNKLIPERMIAARVKNYTNLDTGQVVELDNIIKANMPSSKDEAYEAKQAKAINWLDKNHLGDIVSRELTVPLGKNSEEIAQRLCDLIIRETNGVYVPKLDNAVNYMTLNAALRQRYRDDEPVPSENDGFTVFVGNIAKIKKPKKGK